MQARVSVRYYGNKIFTVRFLDHRYYIRRAEDNSNVNWELRYYTDETEWTIIKVDDTIGTLLDMNESELFQQSCIADYDVYLVKAGMISLYEEHINDIEPERGITQLEVTLEY